MPDWASYLADDESDRFADQFHRHTRTGRPVGSEEFIKGVEARLGRVLRPRKPGPKARSKDTRTRDMFPGFGEE